MDKHRDWLDKQPKCEECEGVLTLLKPHKGTCSKYVHIPDDHYASDCSNGRCKFCNPDYVPKQLVSVTEDELKFLKLLRNAKLTYSEIDGAIKRLLLMKE